MCDVCKSDKPIIIQTLSGKGFCGFECLNEYMHEKDWKALEVRVFRQPKERPKTRLEWLKELTSRITA